MLELLFALNHDIWVGDLLTLFAFAIVAIKLRQSSSSLATQTIIVISSGIILKHHMLANSIASPFGDETNHALWILSFGILNLLLILGLVTTYRLEPPLLRQSRRPTVLFLSLLLCCIVYLQYSTLSNQEQGINYKVWIISFFYLGGALIDGLAIYAIYKLHQMMQTPHLLLARMYILAFSVTATLQVLRFNQKLIFESNLYQDAYQMAFAGINIGTTIVAIVVALLALYQTFVQGEKGKLSWKY